MIYKKSGSVFGQKISLLKEYYHVKTNTELVITFFTDICVSVFLGAGSGLVPSILKGILSKLFIKSSYPIIIGRRFKVINPKNIMMGSYIWIHDDVSISAMGKLKIGNDFVVGGKSEIWTHAEGTIIGNGVGIGKYCYLAQLGGKLIIGDNVLIADSVRMYTLTHKYDDPVTPILLQGYKETKITIKNNVWIGSGVVIVNNVTIGTGSVIGANTIVVKDVPDYVVFAGNPGKIIKRLKK